MWESLGENERMRYARSSTYRRLHHLSDSTSVTQPTAGHSGGHRRCWPVLPSGSGFELHEAGPDTNFDDLAGAASLEPLRKGWVKIDAQRAFLVLASLLQKDLAYKAELMPRRRAEWLAHEFLGAIGQYNSQFATKHQRSPRRVSVRMDTRNGAPVRIRCRSHRRSRIGRVLGGRRGLMHPH